LAQDNNFFWDSATNTLKSKDQATTASSNFKLSSGNVTTGNGSSNSGGGGSLSGASGNVLLKTGSGGGNAQTGQSGGSAGHIILQPGNGGSGPAGQGAGGSTLVRASNSGDILAVQNSAGSTTHLGVANNGNVRVGASSATARLHLGAGTSSLAPLKFTAGTNLTTPAAGAMEWDGTQLHVTPTSPAKRRPLGFGDTAGASSAANHYSTGEFAWNYSSPFGSGPISGSMTHGLAIGDSRAVFRPEDYGGVYNVATIAQAQANSTVIENIKAVMPDTGGIIELRDEFFVYGTIRNLERPYGPVGAINGVSTDGSGGIRISTSAAHGLFTGYKVTIASVGGVPNANGVWIITKVTDTTFDLDGSTFAGSYTSGGTVTLQRTIPFGIVGASPGRSVLINVQADVPAIEWIGTYSPWVPSGVPIFTLRDLLVISQGPGIKVGPAGGAGQIQITNVEASQCKGYGWSFELMYGVSLWNCRAFYNEEEGFRFSDTVLWPSVIESMFNYGAGVFAERSGLKGHLYGLIHTEANGSWGLDFDGVYGDLAIWQEGNHYGATNPDRYLRLNSRLRNCIAGLTISGQTQDNVGLGFDMDGASQAGVVVKREEVDPARLESLEPFDLGLPAMGTNATFDNTAWQSGFRPSIVRDGETLHLDVVAGTYNHYNASWTGIGGLNIGQPFIELFPSALGGVTFAVGDWLEFVFTIEEDAAAGAFFYGERDNNFPVLGLTPAGTPFSVAPFFSTTLFMPFKSGGRKMFCLRGQATVAGTGARLAWIIPHNTAGGNVPSAAHRVSLTNVKICLIPA
jgi:hypothetical protein